MTGDVAFATFGKETYAEGSPLETISEIIGSSF